jgi:hypothetical protein
MPAPRRLEKAKMTAVALSPKDKKPNGPIIEVQFNPESLKLSYANTMEGADKSSGSAIQFVSQSTTKLSFDLWFDVSAPPPPRTTVEGTEESGPVKDVRKLTKHVVAFMQPQKTDVAAKDGEGKDTSSKKHAPPGVEFTWGAFLFKGIVDSVSETIDFFSAEGHALRSQLSVSMTQQEIPADLLSGSEPGALPSPGLDLQLPIKVGDTLQSIAGDLGQLDDWQSLALINDIENPRDIAAGTLLTLGV